MACSLMLNPMPRVATGLETESEKRNSGPKQAAEEGTSYERPGRAREGATMRVRVKAKAKALPTNSIWIFDCVSRKLLFFSSRNDLKELTSGFQLTIHFVWTSAVMSSLNKDFSWEHHQI